MKKFTSACGVSGDRILTPCSVGLPRHSGKTGESLRALWDTGAMCSCISLSLAADLGITPVDDLEVVGANNEPFSSPLYYVSIHLGDITFPVRTAIGLPMDGLGYDVIVGMDIISKGDLSITNTGGFTDMSFTVMEQQGR